VVRLLKIKSAKESFLVAARMRGRLVYVPGGNLNDKRFVSTLRKQKSSHGPLNLMKTGQLYYNAGDRKPENGQMLVDM
jgi:hypothetical protein